MATPDKKRKSARNFNLEKRGGRNFELEKEEVVQEVRPGTVTPEESEGDHSAETPLSTDTTPQELTPPDGTTLGNGKAWIWILLVVIAVVLIVWLMPKGCSSEKQDDGTVVGLPDSVEVVESEAEEDTVSVAGIDGVEGNISSDVSEGASSQAVQSLESANSSETPSASPQSAVSTTPSGYNQTSVASNASNDGSSASSAVVSGNVEEEALKVIRGIYGDGQERKNRLGVKYQEIQNRVNQLKSQGVF